MSDAVYPGAKDLLHEAMAVLGLSGPMTRLVLTFDCQDPVVRTHLDAFLSSLGYEGRALREVRVDLAFDEAARVRVAGVAWRPEETLTGDGEHLLRAADWAHLIVALPHLVGRVGARATPPEPQQRKALDNNPPTG